MEAWPPLARSFANAKGAQGAKSLGLEAASQGCQESLDLNKNSCAPHVPPAMAKRSRNASSNLSSSLRQPEMTAKGVKQRRISTSDPPTARTLTTSLPEPQTKTEPAEIITGQNPGAKLRPVMSQENAQTSQKSKSRQILFVGNLSFSADSEKLAEHFATAKPNLIRLITKRENPGESKGFAFVEFHGQDSLQRMRHALRLHHTLLDGRKINVELTVGGGGAGVHRKQKLLEKNQALNDRRRRRIQGEEKSRASKSSLPSTDKQEPDNDFKVHPNRLNLLQEPTAISALEAKRKKRRKWR